MAWSSLRRLACLCQRFHVAACTWAAAQNVQRKYSSRCTLARITIPHLKRLEDSTSRADLVNTVSTKERIELERSRESHNFDFAIYIRQGNYLLEKSSPRGSHSETPVGVTRRLTVIFPALSLRCVESVFVKLATNWFVAPWSRCLPRFSVSSIDSWIVLFCLPSLPDHWFIVMVDSVSD